MCGFSRTGRGLLALLAGGCALASTSDTHSQQGENPMVRTEGRKVWIEDAQETFHRHFGDLEAGRGRPWAERSDTYMYLAQMRLAGWDVDYADLITIAGYGPSFAYAPGPNDRWMAHYFPIAGRDDRIAHATGYRHAWRQYSDPEEYWQALKRAIDDGKAVHAPNEEDVLFYGYEEAHKPEDRKVMPVAIVFVDEDEWAWGQFVKWHSRDMVSGWFGALEERAVPWPARRSAAEVLAQMVRVARGDDPRARPDDGVVWGIEGVTAYADDLADLSKSGAGEDEGGYFQGGWRGCHNVTPQMSGRPAAAAYLRKVAPLYKGEAREHLEEAAAAYDRATESWRKFDRQLGRALEDVAHDEAWQSRDHRLAAAAAVRTAAGHERDAIDAVEQALAARMSADLYPAEAHLQTPVQADGYEETGNSFGRGLAILLRHAGCDTDYPTVMGDLGQAFLIQGAEYDSSLTGGYADVGWWPLDLWQMESRLRFLSDATGCQLTAQRVNPSEVRGDPSATYGRHFEETVRTEIAQDKPVLSVWNSGFLATGYDGGDPPLLGWCLAAGKAEHMRADNYPTSLYTYGDRLDPMERPEADRVALDHAVHLGRGTAPTRGSWVTGPRAWKGWEHYMLEMGANRQAHRHANMRLQLVASRRCALEYLEAMSRRHGDEVSRPLQDAIEIYRQQIECLAAMQINHREIVAPGRGRASLAGQIRAAAALDAQAIDALERAAVAMQP